MTDFWAKSQDRKRNAASAAICAAVYGAALAAIWLLSLTSIHDLSDYTGPIQIKIGSPEGEADSAFLTGQEAEQAPPELASAEEQAQLPQPEDNKDDSASANTIAIEKSPSPAPSKLAPSPKASPRPSPRISASPKASSTPKPSASPRASAALAQASLRPSASPAASPGAGAGTSASAKPGAAVVKGSEQGNSYETNFAEGSSVVGRGLYVPIYLYLPLPFYVSPEIFNGIKASSDGFTSAESRKNDFRKFYRLTDGEWQLRDTVPFDDRPRLWILLSDSGYKVSGADYKAGKRLRPVVLEFIVGAQRENSIPSLESVKVINSSGYSDIDDAVVYGFKKAAFYNNSPRSVTGRFTYSFD